MVGQKQVQVFSHVETTGGMGQVSIPVGESSNEVTYCLCEAVQFCSLVGLIMVEENVPTLQ